MKILDRYLLSQFLKIFLICVLGVPFIFIVIDLTDRLDTYLSESVTGGNVILHYLYQFPYQTLLAFPIAALLAAVFTVSRMTRHFEITAAKAGGVSFYRLAAPLVLLAAAISLAALALTEIVPASNRRSRQALGADLNRAANTRLSFVYRGNEGRFYGIQRLDANVGRISNIRIDREGTGYVYPSYTVTAPSARWDSTARLWVMQDGRLRYFPERAAAITFGFGELWQGSFVETPQELLADPKDPDEMGYQELGRFIESIERSGGQARRLKVERMLKLSFPLTCFIIVLFGAPLANSTRKGGAALSIGLALATTIVFLTLIRISQALGAGGVLQPEIAAWIPNAIFLAAGIAMMSKVRT